MAGKFKYKRFAELDLSDSFFDKLKVDYPGTATTRGFVDWFNRKSQGADEALVYLDDQNKIGAFMYLKEEDNE